MTEIILKKTFKEVLHPLLYKSLEESKITHFTDIQLKAYEKIKNDLENYLILAETGSGKTYAFLIPLMEKIISKSKKPTRLLIICPTKELAQQITTVAKKLSRHLNFIVFNIIGGENFDEQKRHLNNGQHILIATPGRLADHLEKESISLAELDYLVLDEFDQMLDLGYRPQLDAIFNHLKSLKQMVLTSATLTLENQMELDSFLKENQLKKLIAISEEKNQKKASIEELFAPYEKIHHLGFLKFLIKEHKIKSAIIFCNTKEAANKLYADLLKDNYPVGLMEGDMSTHARKKSMDKLKRKEIKLLISTDLAARGIDIPHLTHVINFDVPLNLDSYIHRIGRTARFLNEGTAITLYEKNHGEKFLKKLDIEFSPKIYKNFTPLNKKKTK